MYAIVTWPTTFDMTRRKPQTSTFSCVVAQLAADSIEGVPPRVLLCRPIGRAADRL
jgi:hypothetical protein